MAVLSEGHWERAFATLPNLRGILLPRKEGELALDMNRRNLSFLLSGVSGIKAPGPVDSETRKD
jgi:hypothetical protein